jgi:hypothetical protein
LAIEIDTGLVSNERRGGGFCAAFRDMLTESLDSA